MNNGVMSMRVNILIKKDSISNGKTVIDADGSILYIPNRTIQLSPFSLYFCDWKTEITTSLYTNGYYSMEYLSGVFFESDFIKSSINIPASEQAGVFLKLDPLDSDGIYYDEHYYFPNTKYFDKSKKIIAVGDIQSEGKCIEFAKENYVLISEDMLIKALFVRIVT